MSAVAQALGNVGPGLTPEIGPVGNYANLADGAKWLLSLAMMLGRLELLTVLVLLSPAYWRG
jgi:trk system potassium uptake protein TrkH